MFSDPFGLDPQCGGLWSCLKAFAAYEWRGFKAGADPTRLTPVDFNREGQFGAMVGRLSLAFGGAGRVGTTSAASRAGIRILEREGGNIVGAFDAAGGEARFITELTRSGNDLILRGTHIEGGATLKEALDVARRFGREMGAERVIIEGGRRSTGLRKGLIPRPIVLNLGPST